VPTRERVLTSLLELVRLPNIFTAPPDVAMGLAVSGAAVTSSVAALLVASACAYAGGMALNDACDATLDARERPERPIPSGRITRGGAFTIAGILLALCLGLGAASGLRPFLVALGLVVAIVVYDAVAKGTALGPAVMASCRALNVGLGIALGALVWPALGAVTILFVYVLVLTLLSRFEVTVAPVTLVRGAAIGFALLLAAAVVLFVLAWGPGGAAGVVFLALLAAWLGPPLRAAIADPAPRRIIAVIKAAVLGIILVDAAFTTASRGLVTGTLVAACFVPAYVLGRRFASA
jgi:4-hydroxybenzoate polyprenyltransferase